MQGQACRNIDRVDAEEGHLRVIEVVGADAEIVVVIAIGAGVVQCTDPRIEIMDADEFRVDRFARASQPRAVELETVFEGEARAVEALVAVGALEAEADAMVAVFVEREVVSGGEGEIVVVEYAAGRFVGHGHETETPGVVLRQLGNHDGRVNRYGGGDEGVVDSRPLVAIVAGYAHGAAEFAGEGRVQGHRRGKELGEAGVLGLGAGRLQE